MSGGGGPFGQDPRAREREQLATTERARRYPSDFGRSSDLDAARLHAAAILLGPAFHQWGPEHTTKHARAALRVVDAILDAMDAPEEEPGPAAHRSAVPVPNPNDTGRGAEMVNPSMTLTPRT